MNVVEGLAPTVSVACGIVFVVTYNIVARWWQSAEGRTLMGVAVVLILFGVHGMGWPAQDGPVFAAVAHLAAGGLLVRLSSLAWSAQVVRSGRRR